MNGEQLCLSLVESGEGEKCIEWDRPSNTLGSAFLYFLWHVLCICGGWQSFDRGQTFFSDRPCHHTINLAHGPSTTFGSRAINLKKCYFEATLCCQSPYFGQNLNLWASMSVALPWLSFVFVCSIALPIFWHPPFCWLPVDGRQTIFCRRDFLCCGVPRCRSGVSWLISPKYGWARVTPIVDIRLQGVRWCRL